MTNRIEVEFLRAYDEYAPHVLRHVYYRVNDKKNVEDIVQNVFFKTWKYIASGGEVKNFKVFLYKVANNLIVDFYRKKERAPFDLASIDQKQVADFGSSQKIENNIDLEILAKMIVEELDEETRKMILLRYVDGLSINEIGEVTGKTANNIRVVIHRGIKKLKKMK